MPTNWSEQQNFRGRPGASISCMSWTINRHKPFDCDLCRLKQVSWHFPSIKQEHAPHSRYRAAGKAPAAAATEGGWRTPTPPTKKLTVKHMRRPPIAKTALARGAEAPSGQWAVLWRALRAYSGCAP